MSVLPNRRLLTAITLAVYTFSLPAAQHHNQPATPQPEQRIPVEPLGYRAPGSLYMLSARAFSSLDYIDAHHLLFTFHQPRLMQREAHPDRRDNDQVIKAIVLNLPGGTPATSAEWRMHDRARYLWALGNGKFLVRQKNSFYLTDASLKLRNYLEVPTTVLTSEVSADGNTLVVEHEYERHTADQHTKLSQQAEQFGDSPPAEDTQVTLIDISTRQVLAALRTDLPVHIPVNATGYASVAKDKTGKTVDQYIVRFVPFHGDAVVMGRVASTCTPHEYFLDQKALMIESCGPRSADVYLDAWTTEGKKLWNGQRDGRLVWPTFAYAPHGGRFAVSLLSVSHEVDLLDSITDEDVRGQVVRVYDSASGALLLAVGASPVLAAGQNFALSEDGEHLAVLHDGAIEIYKVPAPPKQGAGT